MKREILEELNFEIKESQVSKPMATYTPTTEKSAKHVGVIFPVVIEKEFDVKFSDGKCKFIEINKLKDIKNLEPWSELIVKNVLKNKIDIEFSK